MKYLIIIRNVLKKQRAKKYIRILVRKDRAELTVETAIVFTVIMVLICSMIYFGLYLHDKVAIKSYAYSGLVEGANKEEEKCKEVVQNKILRAPTFVIRPRPSVTSDFNRYRCDVTEKEYSKMTFLDKIFSFVTGGQQIEVVRKMPIDKMYLFKAIKDGISK